MKKIIITIFISATLTLQAQVYTGVATHFEALGDPYGGCGVPTVYVDSEHFVALNVFNAPNTGSQDYTRPLIGADTVLMGEFANGMNCGRWVKVTIGEDCIDGINDGALNQEFCRGGTWQDDEYSGASLYMVVTDACGDNNGWCRNSEFHLDLHTSSLNKFEKNGVPVGDMYPLHFNNRKIYWEYVKAPNYTGDIEIFFLQAAQYYWPAIMINHLENGISEIEQKINGVWIPVKRNSDMGQAFILENGTDFTIRIKDIEGNYINYGREYSFSLPTNTSAAVTQSTFTSINPPVTQNINLNQGWNLISINVSLTDSSIKTIFENLNIVELKNMDSFWHKNQPKYLNSLQNLSPGKGYMVYMNTATTLSVTGVPTDGNSLQALSLQNGWNLIGSPNINESLIENTDFYNMDSVIIKTFDGFWIKNNQINSITSLNAGSAYFIYMP